jgi:thiol-disulfide isomerase/thioredoxin
VAAVISLLFVEISNMWRALLTSGLVTVMSAAAWAQDTAKVAVEEKKVEKSNLDKIKENPNDAQAISAYLTEVFTAVSAIMQEEPEKASAQLAEIAKVAESIKADAPAAVTAVKRIQSLVVSYQNRIKVLQTPLADLEKKVAENADDADALANYILKYTSEIGSLARSNPDEATKKVEAFKAGLAKIGENAKEAATKTRITQANTTIASYERTIAGTRKLLEMIGKDAAPLKAEAWVNGSPLTDADLKGKVVFLDFWAVWCGPCIATFPHLREWNEKYGDKGLVMIGYTRYYEYDWNTETKRAARVAGTSHEKEQEMMVKFAESYGLKHRFAIQGDKDVSDYYGVTGIPHVVVIDQQGKIRLMRVGSGEENAKAIGEMLAKLLGDKTTGGQ